MLFGEHFDTFLDNVHDNAADDVRQRIDDISSKEGLSRRDATEEYLARLSEDTDFDRAMKSGWWGKIRELFLQMLARVGIHLDNKLTDSELRYILWRSYENLRRPEQYRSVISLMDKDHQEAVERLRVLYWKIDGTKESYAEYPDNPSVKEWITGLQKDIDELQTAYGLTRADVFPEELDDGAKHLPIEPEHSEARNEEPDEKADTDNIDNSDTVKAAEETPQADIDTRQDEIMRLKPHTLKTFELWLETKKAYDEARQADPMSERTDVLKQKLDIQRDWVETSKDVLAGLGTDLRQLLKDSGVKEEDLREYDSAFLSGKAEGHDMAAEDIPTETREKALRDTVSGIIKESGIDVVYDKKACQEALRAMRQLDDTRYQRVYHGSGADFDSFDNSHMGEGEGVRLMAGVCM